jgi:hypothetical protein
MTRLLTRHLITVALALCAWGATPLGRWPVTSALSVSRSAMSQTWGLTRVSQGAAFAPRGHPGLSPGLPTGRELPPRVVTACSIRRSRRQSVSSSQPFHLNGAIVPVAGIASWPLFAGDHVVTHSAPAIALLRGSGKYFLAGAIVALSGQPLPHGRSSDQSRDGVPSGPGAVFRYITVIPNTSTKAAIPLDGNDNPGNPGVPPYQKPPGPSPYR